MVINPNNNFVLKSLLVLLIIFLRTCISFQIHSTAGQCRGFAVAFWELHSGACLSFGFCFCISAPFGLGFSVFLFLFSAAKFAMKQEPLTAAICAFSLTRFPSPSARCLSVSFPRYNSLDCQCFFRRSRGLQHSDCFSFGSPQFVVLPLIDWVEFPFQCNGNYYIPISLLKPSFRTSIYIFLKFEVETFSID